MISNPKFSLRIYYIKSLFIYPLWLPSWIYVRNFIYMLITVFKKDFPNKYRFPRDFLFQDSRITPPDELMMTDPYLNVYFCGYACIDNYTTFCFKSIPYLYLIWKYSSHTLVFIRYKYITWLNIWINRPYLRYGIIIYIVPVFTSFNTPISPSSFCLFIKYPSIKLINRKPICT